MTTTPRLTELLRMRRFIDAEIAAARQAMQHGTPAQLIQAAADMYDVTREQIHSGSRARSVANARAMTCWLLRQTGLSYPAIGAMLARDHTTVMHAANAIERDPARLSIGRQLLAQEHAADVVPIRRTP